jgi:hypothetical protein
MSIITKKEFLEMKEKRHAISPGVFEEINKRLDSAAKDGNMDFISINTKQLKLTDLMVINLSTAIKNAGYYVNLDGENLKIGLK